MEIPQILQMRLINQQIVRSSFSDPHDLVAYLGAVQAQDLNSALWSIGLRVPGSTVTDVIQAITEKRLIWTWTMRSTLHIVAAEDARWMLELLATRALAKTKSVYRQVGLTEETYAQAVSILQPALRGSQLTRKQIMELWEAAGVSTSNQRGYLMLARMAQEAQICLGPPSEKTQTFVLLDEWLPSSKPMGRNNALAEIMKRYFTSHGPASLEGFVWWTGLTRTETRRSLETILPTLDLITIEDKEYFFRSAPEQDLSPTVAILPGFDEYMLGYTDRSWALRDEHRHHVYTKNAVYPGTLIVDGKVEGTWRRTIHKDNMQLVVSPFETLTPRHRYEVEKLARRYGEFWERNVEWLT